MNRKSVFKLSFAVAMSAVLLVSGWLASAGQGKVRADSTPLPGIAGKYNVFILGDLKGYHSDSEGRMAAGGHITLTQGGYSVGHSLSAAEISEMDSLVAGGNLSYDMGKLTVVPCTAVLTQAPATAGRDGDAKAGGECN